MCPLLMTKFDGPEMTHVVERTFKPYQQLSNYTAFSTLSNWKSEVEEQSNNTTGYFGKIYIYFP